MTYDLTCLYSTVKNTSGRAMTFGFLPPHGRKLLSNEEFTVFGDIRSAIGGNRGGRAEARRDVLAFENAIDRGDLVILNTPAPILLDQNGDPKMLTIDGSGSLATADPCWASSLSGEMPERDM